MPVLFIYPNAGESYRLELPTAEFIIGRSPGCALNLKDSACSRKHAAIFPTGLGYAVRDLGSTNGTYVNALRITGDTELKAGDKLEIGTTIIYFEERFAAETSGAKTAARDVLPVGGILEKPDVNCEITITEFRDGLTRLTSLEEAASRIMEFIVERIHMDRGVLMLMEGSPAQLAQKAARTSCPIVQAEALPIPVYQDIVRTAVGANAAVLMPHSPDDESRYHDEGEMIAAVHSILCVPLWNGKEVIGAIYADRFSALHPFEDTDLRLLVWLAFTAACELGRISRG